MVRLPRFVLCAALAVSWAVWFQCPAPARAQEEGEVEATEDSGESTDMQEGQEEQPADEPMGEDAAQDGEMQEGEEAEKPADDADGAAQAQPLDKSLTDTVESFWHYAKIAKYDLAAEEAQKLADSGEDPLKLLEAFEQISAARRDNLDQWLLRWQRVEALREPLSKLIALLGDGYRTRRADPKFIEQNITRLSVNQRAFMLAVGRLRESGELAVPLMIDYLRDPTKTQHHAAVRRALRELGRAALNPLLAATEMQDAETLLTIVQVLGDIGYDATVPYLARLNASEQTPAAVKTAAAESLVRMGAGDASSLHAPELFYRLAEKFYYDNASIAADPRNPAANVWYWNEANGLMRKEVPAAIFNEVMALRAAEYVLKLDPTRGDAVSLWLAANYKREVELPEAETDPTRGDAQPAAHYYGVAAGTQYLNDALARALRDYNPAVALRVIKSMQEIVGQSNLFTGHGESLVEAMRYPDRRVRFESAFALAASLPRQNFPGQERVVPLLAEAMAQSGKANVLLVMRQQDQFNALMDGLRQAGYGVAGGVGAQAALSAAAALPAVDVIVLTEALGDAQIDALVAGANQSPRLERSAKLVITNSPASPYAVRAVNDLLLNATQASDAENLRPAIEAARNRAGALPLDEQLATSYSLRAAELMSKLAISHGQVLDLSAAHQTLLAALSDARAEVIKAAGGVLGLLDSQPAQVALLQKAADDRTADDVKVSLFKSLATSAKFFGNRLDAAQIESLQRTVATAASLEVRSAAAEARGALNLPAEQAKTLIVEQSKV